MAATTTLLGLVTPTQGTLSGAWGDTVNYGISDYVDIAIAGTLSFTGDAPVTLTNTTGSSSGNSIGSTTAQYACIRVTATTAATKVITGPSYSKTYLVDNASSFAITFKASGQAGVSIAAGEKSIVFYNGTDYVKVATSVTSGVTSVAGTGTVNGITLTGTVTSTGSLTLGGALTGVNLASQVTGTLPVANGGTGTATPAIVAGTNVTVSGSWPNQTINASSTAQVYPGAGIANSTGTAWGTSYTTTGTGAVVALATSPTFVTPALGTPSQGVLSSCTVDGTNAVGFRSIPPVGTKTSSYTLTTGDVGKYVQVSTGGSIVVPNSTFAEGDAISVFNNTSGNITILCNTTTAYIAGTNTTSFTNALAARGVATILFINSTTCVISGNVS
jgi:hypothetical protein